MALCFPHRHVEGDRCRCTADAFSRRNQRTRSSGQDLRNDGVLVWGDGTRMTKFMDGPLDYKACSLANWPQGAPA